MGTNAQDILDKKFTCIEFEQEKTNYRVTDADMGRFMSQEKTLAQKIGIIKLKYEMENGLKPMVAYEKIETQCQIPISTLKSTINGKVKPTRNFVYKFTVGLGMTLEEANELFMLCGGPLSEYCMADFICLCALRDKDDIFTFIEDFQKYTKLKIEIKERKESFSL